jgi:predicted nucleic acid-binding protein
VSEYVTDTMALVLRFEKRKMPEHARKRFTEAEKGQCKIIIPAIVLAELAYLAEKNRIDTNLKKAEEYIEKHPDIMVAALTLSTIKNAFEIGDIPELHDRLIAASGKQLNRTIITNDPVIHSSKHVDCIWDNHL